MKQSNSGHSFGPRDGRAPARIRIISTSSGATGVMKYYGKVPNQIPARQELPQGVKLSRNDMKCVAKQKAAPGYLHNARGRDCCVAVVQNWRTSNGISSCSSLFLTHTHWGGGQQSVDIKFPTYTLATLQSEITLPPPPGPQPAQRGGQIHLVKAVRTPLHRPSERCWAPCKETIKGAPIHPAGDEQG